MIMTRLALIVFVAFWVSLAAAQTKSGDRDWQEVINGAKKEGKVVVAGSPDPVMRNDVIPKFTSRYGITVELIAGRSSQIASRVEIERTAGIYSIDLYLAGQDTSANELYKNNMIDPLRPLLVMPEVIDGAKWKTGKVWFVDPREQFIVRAFSSVATAVHQHRACQNRRDAPYQRSAQSEMARQDFNGGSDHGRSGLQQSDSLLHAAWRRVREESLYRSENRAQP